MHTLFDCVTVAGKYLISYAYRLTVCVLSCSPIINTYIRAFVLMKMHHTKIRKKNKYEKLHFTSDISSNTENRNYEKRMVMKFSVFFLGSLTYISACSMSDI